MLQNLSRQQLRQTGRDGAIVHTDNCGVFCFYLLQLCFRQNDSKYIVTYHHFAYIWLYVIWSCFMLQSHSHQ